MYNKDNIRKIILEELLRNIKKRQALNEVSPIIIGAGAAAAGAGIIAAVGSFLNDPMADRVNRVTTHTPANNVYLMMKNMIDSIDNAQVISQIDARKLARELEDATLDYTVALVPATDEDAVRDIINRSESKINFARVCVEFHSMTGKSFKDVFRSEFGGGIEIAGTGYLKDQKNYVIDPILDLPFIIIDDNGTMKPLTEQEFINELSLLEDDESAADEDCDPPVGHTEPFFPNAVRVMNAYGDKYEISGWVDGPVQAGWDPAHQTCFDLLVKHAFENCDLYSDYSTPSTPIMWKEVSEMLIGEFPGYTYNTSGFLAFCLDAYCCKNTYGADSSLGQNIPSGSSGGSGGGSGGGSNVGGTEDDEDQNRPPSSSKELTEYVDINLNLAGGKGFDEAGFTIPGAESVDERFIQSLLDFRNQQARRTGTRSTSITVYFEVDGDSVSGVETVFGEGSRKIFKNKFKIIRRRLLSIAKTLEFPEDGPYSSGGSFDERKRGRGKAISATFSISAIPPE